MRKSIFDIVSSTVDMASEVKRLLVMSQKETVLVAEYTINYNLFDFVDRYCFKEWSARQHFLNVNDFLNALNFSLLYHDALNNVDSLLTLIELIYNFWELSYQKLDDTSLHVEWTGNYYHLKDVMDDLLEQYNHTAYIDEDNDCVLVIEDKSEVSSVAEIVPENLSLSIIKYNHRSLQGDLNTKKSILVALGAELEPQRKELQELNKQLTSDTFFMLNNMNIRHNNRSKKELAKYKDYVAKMKYDRLEKWYDELYQMMLLAFLLLDNVSRQKSVAELKSKIGG